MMKYRKTVYHFTFLLSILCCCSVQWAMAQSDSVVTIGRKIFITSGIINERREVRIYVPGDYHQTTDTYPVLYLLDGGSHFRHTATMVEYLADVLRIPQMIVVGIPNTDRVRDFMPRHSLVGLDNKVDTTLFKSSGGGDNFLKFLKDELVPYVDKHYRTQPYRILEGHSLGGMFAMYAMEKAPGLFQSQINISAAFYGANSATLREVTPFLRSQPKLTGNIFLAMGNEHMVKPGVDSLVLQFKQAAPPSLRWAYKFYADEDHGSVGHPALYDGLKYIFAGWWMDIYDNRKVITYQDIVTHFKQQSKKFGYEITPNEQWVSGLGYYYLDLKKMDEAILTFQQNINLHPNSPSAYAGLANAYIAKGKRDLAILNFEKALVLNPSDADLKKTLTDLKEKK